MGTIGLGYLFFSLLAGESLLRVDPPGLHPRPTEPVLSLKSPPVDMLYGCSNLKSWCWVVKRDYKSWCWAAQMTTGGAIRQCSSDADCNPYDLCAGGSHEEGLERLELWLESEHRRAHAVYNEQKSSYDAALLTYESAVHQVEAPSPFSQENLLFTFVYSIVIVLFTLFLLGAHLLAFVGTWMAVAALCQRVGVCFGCTC